jgi:two-component system nitrate/nitrite response regulator NarL
VSVETAICSPVRLFAESVAACVRHRAGAVATVCCSLDELSQVLACTHVDVVLLDVTDLGMIAAARALFMDHPQARIIALALPEAIEQVIACADAGFASYVPRDASVEELWSIVEAALREEVVCDPRISRGLLREVWRRRAEDRPSLAAGVALGARLTRRERDVAQLMRHGRSNKEIARHLTLSVATVKNHVHSILGKYSVNSRTDMRWSAIHDERSSEMGR